MIEVNLYSIPSQDINSMVGRCVARSRFDKEGMGVSVMEFVKGFLKNLLLIQTLSWGLRILLALIIG